MSDPPSPAPSVSASTTSNSAKQTYQCHSCPNSYARAEHLERHARTHTGDTFPCDQCSKRFTRSDVLKRHKRVHNQDGSGSEDTASTRKEAALQRTAKACRNCASSKTKCEGEGEPCKRCVHLGKECVYDLTTSKIRRTRPFPSDGDQGDIKIDTSSLHPPSSASHSTTGTSPKWDFLTAAAAQIEIDDAPEFTFNMNNGNNNQSTSTSTSTTNTTTTDHQISQQQNFSTTPATTTISLPVPSAPSGTSSRHGMEHHLYGNGDSTFGDPLNFVEVVNSPTTAANLGEGMAAETSPAAAFNGLFNFPYPSVPTDWDQSLSSMFDLAMAGATPLPNGGGGAGLSGTGTGTIGGTSTGAGVDTLGLGLENNDGLFWSAFESPPNFQADFSALFNQVTNPESQLPAIEGGGGGGGGHEAEQPQHHHSTGATSTSDNTHNSGSPPSKRRRLDEAPKLVIAAAGLATRHQSPEPEAQRDEMEEALAQWPMSWDPMKADSAMEIDMRLEDAAPETLLREHRALVPRFDESARLTILETLRFSSLTDHEYHSLYTTLSRVKLSTFDLMVQFYFQHFHVTYPFIHVPSFNPKSTSGFLLLAIIAIGALHSHLEGSLQLARTLLEVSRRGTEHLVNRDNRIARTLPMIQTMVLWTTVKWMGSPRMMELAQVFREVATTCLRRLRVFDGTSPPPLPPTATLKERWYAWVLGEERKRTGLVCFALEMELTTLLDLPPSLSISELRLYLPSSEALWSAPSPEAWAHLNNTSFRPNNKIRIADLIQRLSVPEEPQPDSSAISPFAAHVLFKALHSLKFTVLQLYTCGMHAAKAEMSSAMRTSLQRLAGGTNEFLPTLGGDEGEYGAAFVSYHHAQISTRIGMEMLEVVAGRGSSKEGQAATAQLLSWMEEFPREARCVALHSAQVVRLIRQYPKNGTYEPASLFLAALCLYLYSRWSASRLPEFNDVDCTIRLDDRPTDACLDWIERGGSTFLEGVGDLASPLAAKRVLVLFAQAVARVGTVWRIGQVLGTILATLASHEIANGVM